MKTQIALRLDEDIVELAKREADRQNRSLANLVETILAESLMANGGDLPFLSILDEDVEGAVALDDDGNVDRGETDRFQNLLAIARRTGRE